MAERKRQRLVAAGRSGVVRVPYFGLADGRRMYWLYREPVLELPKQDDEVLVSKQEWSRMFDIECLIQFSVPDR